MENDVRGASRLAIAGIAGIVDIVEAMHGNIAGMQRLRGRDAFLAALNGVLGDYLAATGNPLAARMALHGPAAPAPAGAKWAVFIHGLCLDERSWRRDGHDYGAALARDLGYTPLYVRYNSGRHVADNGRELAELLEQAMRDAPTEVTEIALVGHSMGGLVARSACHHAELAGHEWRRRLAHAVFLGTPHHGAPLERGGHWLDILLGASRYTAPLGRLGKIRSAGITDLRHGDSRALPQGVACHAIAATTSDARGALADRVGDGLVPVARALGRHSKRDRSLAFDPARQWIAHGVGHLGLLGNDAVYARIREWMKPAHGTA